MNSLVRAVHDELFACFRVILFPTCGFPPPFVRLRDIPPQVSQLTRLEKLTLDGNVLKSLPVSVWALPHLSSLSLAGSFQRQNELLVCY